MGARAVRGMRLFDGIDVVDAEPVVVIDGERIVSVGKAPPPHAETVELGDVTLLPGLIDTHQHLCFDGVGTLEEQVAGVSDEDLVRRARANAAKALRAGITTIRDLGDRDYLTLQLRGDPELPTILASGPPVTVDEGHCWFLGGCCHPADIEAAVEERHNRGCDVVKIMVTGGALTPTFPVWVSQFTVDDVRRAVEAAHRLGLPVAAHCHGAGGIADAVAAGVDTIEHCTFFTSSGKAAPEDDLLDLVAASGITISATLGRRPEDTPPPIVQENLDTIMKALATLRDRGATIVAGTDAGISLGKSHDILPMAAFDFVEIGYAGAEVVAALTSTAARACGVGDRKGRLAPGYDADVIAVAGDPVTDPSALQDVRAVWRGGRKLV